MRSLQREYNKRLNEIAQKPSSLKLPDNPLPSFAARVETCRKDGIKRLARTDAEYKTWTQELTSFQHERMKKKVSDRSAHLADMRAKVEAQRQEQHARDTLLGTFYRGLPHGKLPRPSRPKSEPQLGTYLTAEERHALIEKCRNPIWNKSLKERAEDERGYWKWAAKLKDSKECAVDHHFTGPRGGQTEGQRRLIEQAAEEKRYWKWASSLRSAHACSIDQAWNTM